MSSTIVTTTVAELGARESLMFLVGHDQSLVKRGLVKLSSDVTDMPATICIDGQKVIVSVTDEQGDPVIIFTSGDKYREGYTLEIPSQVMEGTLYQRKNGAPHPSDENCFFITQYPSYFGEAGRIVMDFFTTDDIVAVFKSNSSNFGALGDGKWDEPIRPGN